MIPVVEWVRSTRDLKPAVEPSGENVTEAIRSKAYALGYGEVGFTSFDTRYVYQGRRKDLNPRLPHAICLALEQDSKPRRLCRASTLKGRKEKHINVNQALQKH